MDLTLDIFQKICSDIEKSSIGLKHILEPYEVSRTAFYAYLKENEEAQNTYARAKDAQIELLAEEILDISDDATNDLMTIVKSNEAYEVENKEVVNRSRLRVDSRKWLLSKLNPKKYGEKLDVTSGNEPIKQIFNIGGQEITM